MLRVIIDLILSNIQFFYKYKAEKKKNTFVNIKLMWVDNKWNQRFKMNNLFFLNYQIMPVYFLLIQL